MSTSTKAKMKPKARGRKSKGAAPRSRHTRDTLKKGSKRPSSATVRRSVTSDETREEAKRAVAMRSIEKNLEGGASVIEVAKAAGISRSTFYRWIKEKPDFREMVTKSIEARDFLVEDALYLNALSGHVTAQIFWLCNRAKDRWENVNKVRHSDGDGRPFFHSLAELMKRATNGENGKGGNGDGPKKRF